MNQFRAMQMNMDMMNSMYMMMCCVSAWAKTECKFHLYGL